MMAAPSLGRAVAAAADRLARQTAADRQDAARDARTLVAAALGLDRLGLLTARDRPVSRSEHQAIERLVDRRIQGEPVSRILGQREFWSLVFTLGPETLDPRPDSETVVQAALDATVDRRREPLRVVDLGTGTGCLLLAVLTERPRAGGIGVDRAPGAVRVARANAGRFGLADRAWFVVADWATALPDQAADLLVANPPYIRHGALATLDRGVWGYDPRNALDGGPDGLQAYRAIAADLPRLLAPGGHAVLEIGFDQRHAVEAIVNDSGLSVVSAWRDLSGHARAIVCRLR